MECAQSYHIYNHANGTEDIFREEENYRFFLGQYAKYLGDVLDTYAYCLMPNHFHFLVGVKLEEALIKTFPKFETLEKLVSKKFSNFFSSYTQLQKPVKLTPASRSKLTPSGRSKLTPVRRSKLTPLRDIFLGLE